MTVALDRLRLDAKRLSAKGRYAEALSCLERIVQAQPSRDDQLTIATLCDALGRQDRAQEALEQSLSTDPDDAHVLGELGRTYFLRGRVEQAERCLLESLRLSPTGSQRILINLARIRLVQGDPDAALSLYREGVSRFADCPAMHSALIFALSHDPAADTAVLRQEQARWQARHAWHGAIAPHSNLPDPRRKLRVGYFARSFRNHAGSRVSTPLLLHHDQSQFEIYCYSEVGGWDGVALEVVFNVSRWQRVEQFDDAAFAARVREDQIDVLVDLAGHTHGGRLGAFSRKPAPVQVSGLGFTPGTGLCCIDALLSDEIVLPREERRLGPEVVIDLPCAQLYRMPESAPAVGPAPSIKGQGLTFGCFNRIDKLHPGVWSAWGRILEAFPNARLMLMDFTLGDAGVRRTVAQHLEAAGVAPDRVALEPVRPLAEYLAAHAHIDIALDPFPYSGGLTTLDALWMGVPVVTMRGRQPHARTTATILTRLGLEDLVADDLEGYVARAINLGRDRDRLSGLRAGLRQRLASSSIGDAVRYTSAVESAYRSLWTEWCGRA